jgi:hypothetical protein
MPAARRRGGPPGGRRRRHDRGPHPRRPTPRSSATSA